jgi:hypothetical protein
MLARFTTLKQTQDPSGARCPNPRAPSNSCTQVTGEELIPSKLTLDQRYGVPAQLLVQGSQSIQIDETTRFVYGAW